MDTLQTNAGRIALMFFAGMLALSLSGCPIVIDPGTGGSQADYDLGFDDGFAVDDEYWQGFDDSYYTIDGSAILYSGSSIPFFDELTYDGGYWDGVWYAYNDGYFVAYDYAFAIGFSEGYDLAFYPDYADFLLNDQHVEWLDGGWTDGYNDGFSEGRVFGAWDFANSLPFDWLDASLDYREGTDLTVAGVSTGNNGPVYLYEYGTDPLDLIKSSRQRKSRAGATPSIRGGEASKADVPALSYRALPNNVTDRLNQRPGSSPRDATPLQLKSTWLERIDQYRAAVGSKRTASSRGAAQE